jgi:hypothetical protein
VAITNAQNIGRGKEGMPTLKRKPTKPTLKRGDSGAEGGEKEKDLPTLKRKPGSDN